MSVFKCNFCGEQKPSKRSVNSHKVFCKDNPNRIEPSTSVARKKLATMKKKCSYCNGVYSIANIKKHEKSCFENPIVIKEKTQECPVCEKLFIPKHGGITCSHSCSNTHFRHGNEGGFQYVADVVLVERKDYRKLCFRHHKKICIVCGENKIVSVHHVNEIHDDNRPENLVPLCPTHHQYCHSRYKHIVQNIIDVYIKKWKKDAGLV